MKNIGPHASAGGFYTTGRGFCAEPRGHRSIARWPGRLGALIGAVVAVTLGGGEVPAQTPKPPGTPWSLDRRWDDGKAELLLYDAKRAIKDPTSDGKGGPRLASASYEALFITVKENLDPVKLVKVQKPASLPVLKLVQIHDHASPYGTYVYRATALVRRDAPSVLVKLTSSYASWEGSMFEQIVPPSAPPEQAQLLLRSYREGDRDKQLVWAKDTVTEEQLPLFLRDFVEMTPVMTAVERSFLPALLTGRDAGRDGQEKEALTVASFTFEGKERIPTGLGEIEVARVRVRFGQSGKMEQQQTWWIEVASPHVPVKMISSGGSALLLRARKRAAYWKEPTFRPRTP